MLFCEIAILYAGIYFNCINKKNYHCITSELEEDIMYKIEKTDFGVKITFKGSIKAEEMRQWLEDSIVFLQQIKNKFCIVIDMRDLKALDEETEKILKEGQICYSQGNNPDKGIERSAVFVDNIVTKIQMMRISRETGLSIKERFFSQDEADWEKKADDWIFKGIDPEE